MQERERRSKSMGLNPENFFNDGHCLLKKVLVQKTVFGISSISYIVVTVFNCAQIGYACCTEWDVYSKKLCKDKKLFSSLAVLTLDYSSNITARIQGPKYVVVVVRTKRDCWAHTYCRFSFILIWELGAKLLSIHEYNTNTAPAKYVVVFGLKFEDIFVNTAGTTKSTLQRMKIFAVYYV